MRNPKLLALLVSTLVAPGLVLAQTQDTKPDLAANAALKYWQAFAQMPVLTKDQAKLLEHWNKVPLDEEAAKLIAASEKSRLYISIAVRSCNPVNGASITTMAWALLLTHHIKARDLARLAALHARHEFALGFWESGMEDATAMMALARHVGSEPLIICILMRYMIENDVIDLLAPYLPDLKAFCPKFLAACQALPTGATLQQAFRNEKKFTVWWTIKNW